MSLSSWMYIAYIYLYCLICFHPFVDNLTKRGRSILWVYICMFISFSCFIQKGVEEFWEFMHIYLVYVYATCLFHFLVLYEKGEKDFESLCIYVLFMFMQHGEKNFWSLCMFISLFMHICLFCFMPFIEYIYIYCYAWVKGELLWSLTLIYAYITPWVLSSSKRGRLLALRSVTLVLIMIT